MTDFNAEHNRFVWVDIPVVDLERANAFYAAVLDIEIHNESFQDIKFSVLSHDQGNAGCLVPRPEDVTEHGLLVYLNVDGRIRDAVAKVEELGGKVTEPVNAIGPHGFRAVALDSEGNRIALHSTSDA